MMEKNGAKFLFVYLVTFALLQDASRAPNFAPTATQSAASRTMQFSSAVSQQHLFCPIDNNNQN
jgi:hypothetical protein